MVQLNARLSVAAPAQCSAGSRRAAAHLLVTVAAFSLPTFVAGRAMHPVASPLARSEVLTLSSKDASNWLSERIEPQHAPRPSDEYLERNTAFALRARTEIPAASQVPEELFLREVLPYRHLDEPVDDWRPMFFDALAPHAAKARTLKEVVELVVPRAFANMERPVEFKPNCTPQIMAPVSETLKQGHASCTGCSIFLADVLRAVGVPARVVGTAEWNLPTKGNHNWVEVWTGEGSSDGWHFFDAAPTSSVVWDRAWFVPGNVKDAEAGGVHGIYTPVWDVADAEANYTITWREPFVGIPARDRTEFYKSLKSSCPTCPYTGLEHKKESP